MNARLRARLCRQPAPAIVPFLWDAFDRCDPTRSREQKPSVRMREARQARRVVHICLFTMLAVCGLLALLASNT
ncbi:MAG TPA: hypothetical protein VGE64_00025 [Xanthomonadaceae bacterium]